VNHYEKQLNDDTVGLASHVGDEDLMTIQQDVNEFTECAILADLNATENTLA